MDANLKKKRAHSLGVLSAKMAFTWMRVHVNHAHQQSQDALNADHMINAHNVPVNI